LAIFSPVYCIGWKHIILNPPYYCSIGLLSYIVNVSYSFRLV